MAHTARRRRRRLALISLAVVLALIVVAAVGGYWWQRPMLRTGTGYAAHNACSVTWVAGRDDPATDLPENPLVPYLRLSYWNSGEWHRSATATVLGVLAGQTATYRPGYGCSLFAGTDGATLDQPEVDPGRNPFSDMPVRSSPTVERAIGAAFADGRDDATRQRVNTRAVLVIRDGQIIGERYADGFDRDTRQLGWSMTKSVANLMTGRLVQQKRVAVTDDHLRPEWTDQRADITIEDLLRQRSGLAWDEAYSLGSQITQMLYTEPDMAAFVARQPLAHRPGEYQQYSSGNTNLLCSVLGAHGLASSLPAEQVFAPLGMSSAVLELDGVATPVCSSYLWATPRDWAAIGQLALQNGRWQGEQLLPKDWMAWSTRVHRGPGEEQGLGAGWWVNRQADGTLRFPRMPADTYWASGHDGQRVMVVPSAKLVVVRLGFSPDATDDELGIDRLVGTLAR